MTIQNPCGITSRLLPGVTIGEGKERAEISIDYATREGRDGRVRYQWYVDLADGQSFEGDDLQSGCQGGSLQTGLESLLSFLSAAGTSFRYADRDGENSDLFPLSLSHWASEYSEKLSMLAYELQEQSELVVE